MQMPIRWTRKVVRATVLLSLIFLSTGCLSRTLTVRTVPPGAEVWMNKVPVGQTPVTIPVTYGGSREFIILHEDGENGKKYRPVRVRHDNYQVLFDAFPFDFFVEVLPISQDDHQVIDVVLELSTVADTAEADEEAWTQGLLDQAELLRRRARKLQHTGPPAAIPFLQEKQEPKKTSDSGASKVEGK